MKTKTIVVALATLLIGSLCFLACQKDEGLPVKPDVAEIMDLKAGPANPVMVPFKGKGTWQAVAFSEPDFENMEIEVTVEFEGNATHLGRFEAVWTGVYNFIMVNGDLVPIIYLSHTDVFTAANGDMLYGFGSVDEGTEFTPDDDGIGFLLTGIDIVGGTGRFKNAVGCYELLTIATVGFPFPGGTWKIEGEISFARPMVPFKGKGTWQSEIDLICENGDCFISIDVDLEGTATHLGRHQWLHTVRFSPIFEPELAPGEYLGEEGIFIAANGDKLYVEGCPVLYGSTHVINDDGTIDGTAVYIVGGTGRFENAAGWYDLSGTGSPETLEGTWEIEGRISRPGR